MTDVRARTSPGARIGLRNVLCGLGLALTLLLVTSCGNSTFVPGTPVITLSAKPGRFTSYIVTLDTIYLTDKNGNTFTLPPSYTSERVDLANLSRFTDLFETYPAEVGTYVSATFNIDYSSAIINADINGQSVSAPPMDPSTNAAAGIISFTVQFDPNHPLVVNNQTSAPLDLNIDLEASNIITTDSSGNPQTIVKPFWNVTTVPAYDKPVFARGLYVIADTKNNNFIMNTRPLHDQVNTPFGSLLVNVNDQTYYQINGTTYVGAAGLAALSALQNAYADLPIGAYSANSPTPFGNLNTIQPSMTATQVFVGSSLESTIEGQISGVVQSVTSDVVTVANASYVDQTGTVNGFTASLPMAVGPATIVSIDGVSGGTPSLDSISPGQFITATGIAPTFDTSGVNPTAFDATGTYVFGAQVRLQNTTLWGDLVSATPGNLVLNLQYIENAGPPFTPNAAGYQVATGATDESATPAGTLLKLDGLVNAPANNPPFFTAAAVTAGTALQSQLVIEIPAGSTTALTGVTGSAITVNLADAGFQAGTAQLLTGPVTIQNLLSSPPTGNVLTISYNTGNAQYPPLYGVGSVALGQSLFSDPNGFATKVTSLIPANAFYKVVATGQYDPTSGTFAATNITINAK